MDFEFFRIWVLLPFLIFIAQVTIVSLATLRIIYLSKNLRITVALIGFFEVLLWLFSVATIVQNLTNPLYYFAYALGFATGNYLGVVIEGKLASGIRLIRIITKKRATKLIKALKKEKCRITNVVATGEGFKQVNVLYVIVKRKNLPLVASIIRYFHPKSFFSVEEINYLDEGAFPLLDKNDKKKFKSFKKTFSKR